MRKNKQWDIDVSVVGADGKVAKSSQLSFTAPRWMTSDEAMKFAKGRLESGKMSLRSLNVGAPLESRRIVAYVGGQL
jgi:hypothetical protein